MMKVEVVLQEALNHVRNNQYHEAVACLERGRSELGAGQERELEMINARLKPLMDKMERDPFFALKCDKNNSKKQIRQTYLSLAKTFHPDKSAGTLSLFQTIQGAFEKVNEGNGREEEISGHISNLKCEEKGNEIVLTWKDQLKSKNAVTLVQYEIEMTLGKPTVNKSSAITTTKHVETQKTFRVRNIVTGMLYRFRVRVGLVNRITKLCSWGPYSRTISFSKPFLKPVITDSKFDSANSCVMRWDTCKEPLHSYQVQYRMGVDQEWKNTVPKYIRNPHCRKKNIKETDVLQFRVRVCHPKYFLFGAWSKILTVTKEEDQHHEVDENVEVGAAKPESGRNESPEDEGKEKEKEKLETTQNEQLPKESESSNTDSNIEHDDNPDLNIEQDAETDVNIEQDDASDENLEQDDETEENLEQDDETEENLEQDDETDENLEQDDASDENLEYDEDQDDLLPKEEDDVSDEASISPASPTTRHDDHTTHFCFDGHDLSTETLDTQSPETSPASCPETNEYSSWFWG